MKKKNAPAKGKAKKTVKVKDLAAKKTPKGGVANKIKPAVDYF